MRPFSLAPLAIAAAFIAGCDSSSDPEPADPVRPSPVLSTVPVLDSQGVELGEVSAAEIAAVLSEASDAPLAAELVPLIVTFPNQEDDDGEVAGPSGPGVVGYPTPFNAALRIALEVPAAERARFYLVPAVPAEGEAPPQVRSSFLVETPDGFDGVLIADGPATGGLLTVDLSPQLLGMEYGLYQLALYTDGARSTAGVFYAPCVDGVIVGGAPCE